MKILSLKEHRRYLGYASMESVVGDPDELLERLRSLAGDIEVQIISPEPIAGESHLFAAGLNALNAFKNRLNLSKSISIEFLIYLSGQRQIRNAIEIFGVKRGSNRLVVVAFARKKHVLEKFLKKVPNLLQCMEVENIIEDWSEDKISTVKKVFNITDLELKAVRRSGEPVEDVLKKLVLESVALLSIQI